MSRVLGDAACDLDPKVKGQLMYFLVNASPHKFLVVATSNCLMMSRVLGNTSCDLGVKVN